MRFSEIPGQEQIKRRLREMVDADRIPHALLIEGPTGTGKMMLARAMAQYIHCQNRTPDGDSCGRCPACLQHQSFNHIDTIYSFPVIKKNSKETNSDDCIDEWRHFLEDSPWMDFATWQSMLESPNAKPYIYVSEGAALIRRLSFTAHSNKYKVVIMWLPERMMEQCANKILKLVEEPFADTIFIMVSDNPRQILPTIYSRTQRVEALRYTDAEVSRYLQSACGLEADTADEIAPLAQGNMLTAVKLVSTHSDDKVYLDYFIELMRLAYQRKVGMLKAWALKVNDLGRERIMRFMEYCQRLVRENFILNLNVPALNVLTRPEADFSRNFARFINERNVADISKQIDAVITDIAANANGKLVLFDFAIKMILLLKR